MSTPGYHMAGEIGYCRTGEKARVAGYNAHFGEESPLVGSGGSGTIFFAGCNLGCLFCQNYEISHLNQGVEVTDGQLAIMLSLQKQGCHNINLVTPTHVLPQFLAALSLAVVQGLCLPLVYSSSGYDSLESLQFLGGIVDLYMPDFKFWSASTAMKLCGVDDYPTRAQEAILEMHRQVGDLVVDNCGVAQKGLLKRHLVMPGLIDESRAIMEFIAGHVSPDTYVNLMDQYHPCGRAIEITSINCEITAEEYHEALQVANSAGLKRLAGRDWLTILKTLGVIPEQQ